MGLGGCSSTVYIHYFNFTVNFLFSLKFFLHGPVQVCLGTLYDHLPQGRQNEEMMLRKLFYFDKSML